MDSSKGHERIARLVIAALSASDVSGREIRRFGEDLMRGTGASRLFGSRVRELGKLLEEGFLASDRPDFGGGSETDLVMSEIMRLVKSRRLSKSVVVHAVEEVWPEGPSGLDLSGLTVGDVVRQLVGTTDAARGRQLLDLLRSQSRKRDDYLKGIMEG